MLLVAIGSQTHVLIRAGGVELPHLLARAEVIGIQAAARGEFIATETDDDLTFSNERSRCDRLTLGRPRMLDDPNFLAGLGIERNDEAVERAKHELAVRKGHAAIHRVAAGARHSRCVAVRRLGVVPELLRMVRVGQVQCLNDVWPTAFHVHHWRPAKIHYERLSLMAAQRSARLRPDHLQL
jgi:hypothetical protein